MRTTTLDEFVATYAQHFRRQMEGWRYYVYWGVSDPDAVLESAAVRGFVDGLMGARPPSMVDPEVGPDAMRWTPEMAEEEMAEWRKLLDA